MNTNSVGDESDQKLATEQERMLKHPEGVGADPSINWEITLEEREREKKNTNRFNSFSISDLSFLHHRHQSFHWRNVGTAS